MGAPLHFISQILDVTAGERERQSLEAVFETVSVGLLLIGGDGRYERMNRRHQETRPGDSRLELRVCGISGATHPWTRRTARPTNSCVASTAAGARGKGCARIAAW